MIDVDFNVQVRGIDTERVEDAANEHNMTNTLAVLDWQLGDYLVANLIQPVKPI